MGETRSSLFASRCCASFEVASHTYGMCGLPVGHEGEHEAVPLIVEQIVTPTTALELLRAARPYVDAATRGNGHTTDLLAEIDAVLGDQS